MLTEQTTQVSDIIVVASSATVRIAFAKDTLSHA